MRNIVIEGNDMAGTFSLTETDSGLYLSDRMNTYLITGNPREPDLYVRDKDGTMITIHNAFTPQELLRHAENGELMRMVTGNEHGAADVCRLILLAVRLGQPVVDISYAEGHRFMEIMRAHGAFSKETAVGLSAYGLKNDRMMYPFLHSKKVMRTDNGSYYLNRTKDKNVFES